jgi:hypothetical protein
MAAKAVASGGCCSFNEKKAGPAKEVMMTGGEIVVQSYADGRVINVQGRKIQAKQKVMLNIQTENPRG